MRQHDMIASGHDSALSSADRHVLSLLLPPRLRARLALAGDGNICFSGAAPGADLEWGTCADLRGHLVIHWSFARHRRHAPPGEIVVLTPDQLAMADPALARAAEALGRPWPTERPYVANLLRRDYFQIAWSGAVYAVANLDRRGAIEGSTAWTVQMFLDRFHGEPCPAWLFEQRQARWLAWTGAAWAPIDLPPAPSGCWAGVGSRDLGNTGRIAIRDILRVAQ